MNRLDVSASAGVSRPSSPESAQRLRSLSGLSDGELLSRVKDLVSRERAVTLEVLVHLIEVERRRLHVGLGYASMFDYCTRHLGYSSSSSARRIHTARCLRDYPEVLPLLEKNDVNLSTVSLVSSILTRENYKDILERIRGKSQKEVEGIVADYRPPVSLRDRAKPVWVAVPSSGPSRPETGIAGALSSPASSGTGAGSGDPGDTAPIQRTSRCDHSRCGSNSAADFVGGRPQAGAMIQALRQAGTEPLLGCSSVRFEKKRFVQFVASEQFVEKLEKAKALLSNGGGDLSYEFVLEAALDEFLKDHDPEERNRRRDERKQKAESRADLGERGMSKAVGSRAERRNSNAGSGQADGYLFSSERAGRGSVDGPLFRRRAEDRPPSREPSRDDARRRIPAAMRDAVFASDKGRCTYIGTNGERCAATHHLQIDHVVPFARGGTNALDNLRLLCERHNKKEAERAYGANVMRKFRGRE